MTDQTTNQKEQEYNDSPLITYSNRIQKHMYLLTEQLSTNATVELQEKRKLKLLIENLPPQAKQRKDISQIITILESNRPLTTLTFDRMYGIVSDWIYDNVLQSAYRVRPLCKEEAYIGSNGGEDL